MWFLSSTEIVFIFLLIGSNYVRPSTPLLHVLYRYSLFYFAFSNGFTLVLLLGLFSIDYFIYKVLRTYFLQELLPNEIVEVNGIAHPIAYILGMFDVSVHTVSKRSFYLTIILGHITIIVWKLYSIIQELQ